MAIQNKLSQIISLTGISTVGIYTVGVTETAGGTGIGSMVNFIVNGDTESNP